MSQSDCDRLAAERQLVVDAVLDGRIDRETWLILLVFKGMNAGSAVCHVRLLVGFVLVFGAVQFAHAWGSEGHQVIALIAQAQLTPRAKAEIERLLAIEPGEILASIFT